MKTYIAHQRSNDKSEQNLFDHLTDVAQLAGEFASKIGLQDSGIVIGLLHDFGKYSLEFQQYIKSAVGIIEQDDEDWVDAELAKGKIDHSTAGAQYVWQKLSVSIKDKSQGELCGQILALCIASHHSGLIDCLNEDGYNNFMRRMTKCGSKTHLYEALKNADAKIKSQAESLLTPNFVKKMLLVISKIIKSSKGGHEFSLVDAFTLGVFTRFLFSCLIDADRLNSAEFEDPSRKLQREKQKAYFKWQVAIDRLEGKLKKFAEDADKPSDTVRRDIDTIRQDISESCSKKALDDQGIYTLSVPTGGGKTLASLRYALKHAQHHNLDRIIYIIPYTSIIEQNADAVRKIVEKTNDELPWVLEHHSNLEPERQTWHYKLASENWDAPIVFITMVQFLETLFSGGTRSVRRMHQLAKSVLVFDEIQTLPTNCIHLFCNSLNFLVEHAQTTAVLCTATQPLLNKLPISEYGELRFAKNPEIVEDKSQLFLDLKRVDVVNRCKSEGWSRNEIVNLVKQRFKENLSCLVVVNTKSWAKDIFIDCQSDFNHEELFHLSTNQCPAHRKQLLSTIRKRLEEGLPVICISTQLIEAGVDVDFCNVIRFLAGLDSIAQAAGRCNREGKLKNSQGDFIQGLVEVINPAIEPISSLADIVEGQEVTRRVFGDIEEDAILSPEAIELYFKYYFFNRRGEMIYPVKNQDDCLLNILANNDQNNGSYANTERVANKKIPLLQQSFMAAAKAFKAIDAPTYSVIVQYGEGKEIVSRLCGINKEFNAREFYKNIKQAQQYSVNIFRNKWDLLKDNGAITEIQVGEGIYYLNEQYYTDEFGINVEMLSAQANLMVK